jgi:alpha-galactosidase
MHRSVPTYIVTLITFVQVPHLSAQDKPTKSEKPNSTETTSPLKVYILAGQSNMQGHAKVSTFDSLADDPKTAPLLKQMRDKDGKPKVCDKVWISSVGCLGNAYDDLREQTGKLTAGFGAGGKDNIGPEFTFGLTLEERLKEPVLLIKTSWGGRSLHTDFRSPSAGPFVLAKETQELWDKHPKGAHGIPKVEDRPKFYAEKVAATGVYYREMIAQVRKVLKDIKRVVPDYDDKQGFELAGFVWFQGFNDYVDGGVYPKHNQADRYDLYADLLGHFIRDVRKDLSAPKLPFVIGVMGIDGLKGDKKAPMMHFREAQRKPAALAEFKGNVFVVETAPFWDDELEALQDRKDRLYEKLEQEFRKQTPKPKEPEKEVARKKALDAEFKPEELMRLKAGVSNGGYHYLGAAKILAPVGKAFADALLAPKPTEPKK